MVWRPTLKIDSDALHMCVSSAASPHAVENSSRVVRVVGSAHAHGPLVTAPVSRRKVVGFTFSGMFYDLLSDQQAPFSFYEISPFSLQTHEGRVQVLGEFPLILRLDVSEVEADAREHRIARDLLDWVRRARPSGSARILPHLRWREACIEQGEPISVWGVCQQGNASTEGWGYRDTAFSQVVMPPADGVGVISDLSRGALLEMLASELDE